LKTIVALKVIVLLETIVTSAITVISGQYLLSDLINDPFTSTYPISEIFIIGYSTVLRRWDMFINRPFYGQRRSDGPGANVSRGIYG
jgi:hypothetical protein